MVDPAASSASRKLFRPVYFIPMQSRHMPTIKRWFGVNLIKRHLERIGRWQRPAPERHLDLSAAV
jgi:hypothetical protein